MSPSVETKGPGELETLRQIAGHDCKVIALPCTPGALSMMVKPGEG